MIVPIVIFRLGNAVLVTLKRIMPYLTFIIIPQSGDGLFAIRGESSIRIQIDRTTREVFHLFRFRIRIGYPDKGARMSKKRCENEVSNVYRYSGIRLFSKPQTIFCWMVLWLSFCIIPPLQAQNVTPQPTVLNPSSAVKPKTTPTPIRRLNAGVQRLVNVRLEAVSDTRMVFSDNTGTQKNRRFYVWDPKSSQLIDTLEDGVPGSVRMPEDGRYMIFLFDEINSYRGDVNGDGRNNVFLRLFHFSSNQKVNLDLPARSATPLPGEQSSNFEYELSNDYLAYSKSDSLDNSVRNTGAPWHIMNLLDIVYAIEGTPTPTPTYTSIQAVTPTPTHTPGPTPTRTPIPTVPPEFRSNADINADGKVNQLDLLMFQYFWGTEKE